MENAGVNPEAAEMFTGATSTSLKLDGNEAWPELRSKMGTPDLLQTNLFQIACLENATAEGRPSVAFRFDLPDGKVLIAEATMRSVFAWVTAMRARFGDVDKD